MPFLCQAFLLPPGLAVALLPSSPHTRVCVGMCGKCFLRGQPRKQRFAWNLLSHWIHDITQMSSRESPASCKLQNLSCTLQAAHQQWGGGEFSAEVAVAGDSCVGRQPRCADDYGFHSGGAAAAAVPAPFAVLLQLASTCPLKCQPRSRGLFMQHLGTSTG